MVQSTGLSQNQFGTVTRIGMTQEGRAVYQVVSADGQSGINVSIPGQDCDRFERAYNDLTVAAPKLQAYMESHSSPEEAKKIKKRTAWTIGGTTGVAFLATAIATKKWKPVWKWITSIAGGIAGLFGGAFIAAKMNTPPGAKEFENASKVLSSIDVQPLQ